MSDREDGGDGIHRKNDIGGFDDDQDEHQKRGFGLAGLANEKILTVIALANRHPALEQTHHGIFFRLQLFVALKEHLDAGEDQESAEDVNYPVKIADQSGARGDEDRAQNEGAEDAPE